MVFINRGENIFSKFLEAMKLYLSVCFGMRERERERRGGGIKL